MRKGSALNPVRALVLGLSALLLGLSCSQSTGETGVVTARVNGAWTGSSAALRHIPFTQLVNGVCEAAAIACGGQFCCPDGFQCCAADCGGDCNPVEPDGCPVDAPNDCGNLCCPGECNADGTDCSDATNDPTGNGGGSNSSGSGGGSSGSNSSGSGGGNGSGSGSGSGSGGAGSH